MTQGPRNLVVGLDLDLTLVDTRAAIAFALEQVNCKFGSSIDIDDFIRRLGQRVCRGSLEMVLIQRVGGTVVIGLGDIVPVDVKNALPIKSHGLNSIRTDPESSRSGC